jgi:hypothetical protein
MYLDRLRGKKVRIIGLLVEIPTWDCPDTKDSNHPPPSSAEVKESVELYLHSPNMSSGRGAQLKHRDNFTFYLYYSQLFQLKFNTNKITLEFKRKHDFKHVHLFIKCISLLKDISTSTLYITDF